MEKIDFEAVLVEASRLPYVKIDRELFLRKELRGKYSKEIVDLEMLILVLVIIFDFKDIRIIDNTLRRQLLQLIDIAGCILGAFRSNLIAVQNAKALEH